MRVGMRISRFCFFDDAGPEGSGAGGRRWGAAVGCSAFKGI